MSKTTLSADERLLPWVAAADQLIADRLADARAHAEGGATYEANQRIAELWRDLLDDQSGAGSLLSNARASFYTEAFLVDSFDPEIHRTIAPDKAGELTARFSPIGGRNQYVDARLLLEDAGGSLRALVASRTIVGESKPPDLWRGQFQAWQARHTDTITRHMRGALSDAQMALRSAVGQLRVKPELQ
jgi:hypothetical protein